MFITPRNSAKLWVLKAFFFPFSPCLIYSPQFASQYEIFMLIYCGPPFADPNPSPPPSECASPLWKPLTHCDTSKETQLIVLLSKSSLEDLCLFIYLFITSFLSGWLGEYRRHLAPLRLWVWIPPPPLELFKLKQGECTCAVNILLGPLQLLITPVRESYLVYTQETSCTLIGTGRFQ